MHQLIRLIAAIDSSYWLPVLDSSFFHLLIAFSCFSDRIVISIIMDNPNYVEVTDDDQCEEVHDDVHDRIVCLQNHQVDNFNAHYHEGLSHPNAEGHAPVPKLPRMVHRVLHHSQTLLCFVLERNVQENGAKEARYHDLDTRRRCIESLSSFCTVECLEAEKPEQS